MGADLTVARRFGANLRQLRRQADLSQEEVGARASLHRTEIGLLEGIEWTPGKTEAGAFTAQRDVRR